jgi:hypothetical protein
MSENSPDGLTLGDDGEHAQAAMALGAVEHVDLERAAQQSGPINPRRVVPPSLPDEASCESAASTPPEDEPPPEQAAMPTVAARVPTTRANAPAPGRGEG